MDCSAPSPSRLPFVLAIAYVVWWVVLAIDPVSRTVWWAENIPVMVVFALLLMTYRHFQFSRTAYVLMAIWLFWHTLGGHYTFAAVPFDFVTETFGFARNHFDRIGHFAVGLYAFAITEWLLRCRLAHKTVAYLFGLFAIMAVAAGYEIIEWWYAALEGGDAGIAFLGSQGDIWDAQKDMFADTLGALFSLALYAVLSSKKAKTTHASTSWTEE
ncbi:DUF2238 domain-containing protein [Desulfovibrio inopinatus]|uniref:DUF2238 domain-containing protein n=1 Tax=Desulfovibrio inopinatus TaxID=102109 RepID=UPI000400858B|nr:DUF2238 domain-containing protein [Desulfovibrio inopinatus]